MPSSTFIQKSWLAENYTEYVNLANEHTKGALSITFKRNVNIFEALQKVKEIITFTFYKLDNFQNL
jgi:hypothetical protein